MNAKHAPPMLAPSSLQISLLLRAVNEAEPELAPSCCLSISAGRLPCHSQSYLQVTVNPTCRSQSILPAGHSQSYLQVTVNPTCRLPCHSQSYLQVTANPTCRSQSILPAGSPVTANPTCRSAHSCRP